MNSRTSTRFDALVEQLPVAVLVVDADGRVALANAVVEDLIGEPAEQLIGQLSSAFIHPEDVPASTQMMAESLSEAGRIASAEFRVKLGRGGWLDVEGTAVHRPAGAGIDGIVLVLRDISKRRRAAVRERAARDLLHAISRAQSAFIARGDSPHRAFENLLQDLLKLTQSEQGFIGEVLSDRDDRPYLRLLSLTKSPANGSSRTSSGIVSLEFTRLDTLYGHVITTGSAAFANAPPIAPSQVGFPADSPALEAFAGLPCQTGGRLIGMVGLANRPGGYDESLVTYLEPLLSTGAAIIESHQIAKEQHAADQALRESEAHFRALFDNAMEAMLICDGDRRLLDANSAACSLLARTETELVTMKLYDLLPERGRSEGESLWTQLQRQGTIEGEIEAIRPDGTTRLVRYRARAQITTGRHLIVFHDLTEQRNLEGQFLQAQKMEPLGRLAGGIAHDFNNLLTAITGYTEFLADQFADNDPRMRDLDEIRKATERAAALTRQLLAFSRKQVLKISPIDLNAVVTNMERMLQRLIGEDISLTTLLASDLQLAHADAGQIEQVIVNLAVNARDAMPRGGHLRLETNNVVLRGTDLGQHTDVAPGPYVFLAVSDTGMGMDNQTRLRLFEPFFTTKERGRGTGLGLSTVYGIVKQCGGHITVTSELGRGTTFRIFLPSTQRPKTTTPATIQFPPVTGGNETILVVEDDASVLRLAREALERRGYTVLTAAGWLEALDLVARASRRIDLVLTDVVMPGMGGRALAERIRLLRPEVQILYMSGYPDDAIDQHGVVGSEVTLIEKPFTAERLAIRVRETLDR